MTENSTLDLLAPSVKFPVTVCVVCYGVHADLAQRFLDRLYANTDPALFRLRAGLNEVEGATLRLFEEAAARHGNIELTVERENIYKNPMMRRLLHDRRLDTEWTIWFDDDSFPHRRDWLHRLAVGIENSPETTQWGALHQVYVGEDIRRFVESAPWSRGRPMVRAEGGPPDPDSPYTILFSVGGFWAIRSSALQDLDWPDPRILQAAEDCLLGEALRQNGMSIGTFDYGVAIDTVPRRNPDGDGVRILEI